MPEETKQAVEWALQQDGVFTENPNSVVDKVRQYFNIHNIDCRPMCYDDLIPYI